MEDEADAEGIAECEGLRLAAEEEDGGDEDGGGEDEEGIDGRAHEGHSRWADSAERLRGIEVASLDGVDVVLDAVQGVCLGRRQSTCTRVMGACVPSLIHITHISMAGKCNLTITSHIRLRLRLQLAEMYPLHCYEQAAFVVDSRRNVCCEMLR